MICLQKAHWVKLKYFSKEKYVRKSLQIVIVIFNLLLKEGSFIFDFI